MKGSDVVYAGVRGEYGGLRWKRYEVVYLMEYECIGCADYDSAENVAGVVDTEVYA